MTTAIIPRRPPRTSRSSHGPPGVLTPEITGDRDEIAFVARLSAQGLQVSMVGELVNALRHSLAAGGTRLEVALSVEGTDATLTVADDGPGFAPSAPTHGTGQGTGIVDDLVRISVGTIERRSGVGGTTVTVKLPLDMVALARVRNRG